MRRVSEQHNTVLTQLFQGETSNDGVVVGAAFFYNVKNASAFGGNVSKRCAANGLLPFQRNNLVCSRKKRLATSLTTIAVLCMPGVVLMKRIRICGPTLCESEMPCGG